MASRTVSWWPQGLELQSFCCARVTITPLYPVSLKKQKVLGKKGSHYNQESRNWHLWEGNLRLPIALAWLFPSILFIFFSPAFLNSTCVLLRTLHFLHIRIIKSLLYIFPVTPLAPWLCLFLDWLSQLMGNLLSRWKAWNHMEHYFWPQICWRTFTLRSLLWILKSIIMIKNPTPVIKKI